MPCRQPSNPAPVNSLATLMLDFQAVAYMQVARPVVTVPGVTAAAVAAPDISAAVVVSSVVVGITTSLILFCSHFHQIAGDTAANKFSPLVKIGTANGVKVTCCLAVVAPACLQHMYGDVARLTWRVAW